MERTNQNYSQYRKFSVSLNIFVFDKCIFRQIIKELIPTDLMKMMSSSEWKRNIVASYNQDAGMSADDAKIAFLKIVYR